MLSEDTVVTERRISGAGVGLAVFERGDTANPTVVLVHGFPDTHSMWGPVVERLAGRFHVVTYDVRGAGASSAPPERSDYAIERLVEDLAAVIDAVSPGRPVHLVGHDWGSIQSWEAVCLPHVAERIASFTSMGAPSVDHAGQWIRDRVRRPTPRALLQLIRQGLRSWYITAFRLPGAARVWRRNARRFARYVERFEGIAPTEDYPAPTLGEDAARGVNMYRASMGMRLRHPRERHTRVPVQLIVAVRDRYATPALFDGIERIAPSLTRRDIDAGHWVPRTHPDLISSLIADFAAANAQEAA